MLKLESTYKNSFPKNQDSRLRSLENIPLLDSMSACTNIVPTESTTVSDQAFEIAVHINYILCLPEDEYEDIWEVVSLSQWMLRFVLTTFT